MISKLDCAKEYLAIKHRIKIKPKKDQPANILMKRQVMKRNGMKVTPSYKRVLQNNSSKHYIAIRSDLYLQDLKSQDLISQVSQVC